MAKEKEVVQAPEAAPAEKELTFVFKVSQANIILQSLDEIPHKLSRGIIDSMQQQAAHQLQESAE